MKNMKNTLVLFALITGAASVPLTTVAVAPKLAQVNAKIKELETKMVFEKNRCAKKSGNFFMRSICPIRLRAIKTQILRLQAIKKTLPAQK